MHGGKKTEISMTSPRPAPVGAQVSSCRELLEMMPLDFDRSAVGGLEAVYQFDVSGDETFQACLKINGDTCSYHEGPAAAPGIVIHTPGEVWIAIAKGELDGQQAFMAGRYTVEGDLSLLLKLPSLFPRKTAA
jgi:putative sterol carrier protein